MNSGEHVNSFEEGGELGELQKLTENLCWAEDGAGLKVEIHLLCSIC